MEKNKIIKSMKTKIQFLGRDLDKLERSLEEENGEKRIYSKS